MNMPLSGAETPSVLDSLGRPLQSLRLSVTDRCNLRCKYCMPEEEYAWLPRETILTFEEMATLTRLFTELGVDKVRLTGGEPLLRRDLPVLIKMLGQNPRIKDLALTTNGILLTDQAEALGVINTIDADKRSVNVTHGPVEALGWPKMTMDLPVTRRVDLSTVETGSKVRFTLKQGRDKQFRIIAVEKAE